jgi:hypothetical protein
MIGGLLIASRVVLAAVFAVAGVTKLIDRPAFQSSVYQLGLPVPLATWTARLLPILELAIALALLPSVSVEAGAVAAVCLLLVVSAVRIAQLIRGDETDCHCFGRLRAFGTGYWLIARNAVLATIGLFLAVMAITRTSPSGISWAGDVSPTTWLVASILVVLLIGLSGGAVVTRRLLQQQKFILTRVETLEANLIFGAPVALQEPDLQGELPDLNLTSLAGSELSLRQLLASTPETLFVFVEQSCRACETLLRAIRAHDRERTTLRTIIVLAATYPAFERTGVELRERVDDVLVDQGDEVATSFGVHARPAALVVSTAGDVLTWKFGLDDVLELLAAHWQGPAPIAS